MLKTLTSLGGGKGYVQVFFTHVPVGDLDKGRLYG